jgi:hypothetical protein
VGQRVVVRDLELVVNDPGDERTRLTGVLAVPLVCLARDGVALPAIMEAQVVAGDGCGVLPGMLLVLVYEVCARKDGDDAWLFFGGRDVDGRNLRVRLGAAH